jgi:hypothetical protein
LLPESRNLPLASSSTGAAHNATRPSAIPATASYARITSRALRAGRQQRSSSAIALHSSPGPPQRMLALLHAAWAQ